MSFNKVYNLGTALLALIFGGTVYLLWRDPTLWMFRWCNSLGLGEGLFYLRGIAANHQPPYWAVFSFPDGTWAFAGTVLMRGIWAPVESLHGIFWVLLIPFLVVGSEIGQRINLVPGGFDPNDLLAYFFATALAFAFPINQTKP